MSELDELKAEMESLHRKVDTLLVHFGLLWIPDHSNGEWVRDRAVPMYEFDPGNTTAGEFNTSPLIDQRELQRLGRY